MSAGLDADAPRPYRQKDVLALLARGLSAAESARVLGVSTSTIEHERTELRRALGARTPPHLVAIAYETGILPLEAARLQRLESLIRTHLL
jgi:DNA-binding CsgD family transcriptional regulator